jgi:hypothetical protein
MGHVIEFSRITPAYLENMAKKDPNHTVDLTGKIIFVDELRGIQSAQAPKLLISEGRLRLGTVSENRQSVEIEVKGTPTIITTTTQPALEDPEFENRVIPIQIDETEDHTRAVIEHEAELFADPAEGLSQDTRLQGLVDFLSQLKPCKIANPFATLIAKDYPVKNIEARRDFKKLMALSNVVTWLYQNQRRTAKKGVDIAIVTDLADVEKVKTLALAPLRESLAGLSEKEERILEVARESVKTEVKRGVLDEESNGVREEYQALSVKEFMQKTRKTVRHSESWTRDHVKRMADEGYLTPVEQKNAPFTWRYSDLQPESLEIKTEKYSNTIISAWAESYGYTLFDTEKAVPLIPAQLAPRADSEPALGTHSESVPEVQHTPEFEPGQASNEVTHSRSPESIEKVLCRSTFEKSYRRLGRNVTILDSLTQGRCEDCDATSDLILVRVNVS